MLFDARPKVERRDLFDREEEYGQLHNLLRINTPLILIKGLRRSGKTSLLRTYLNEEERSYIWVDLRALATNTAITKSEILTRFQLSINTFIDEIGGSGKKLLAKLGSVNGIQILGNGISFIDKNNTSVSDLMSIFETLDRWVVSEFFGKQHVVLAIDEAQKFGETEQGFDMTQLFASIFDNCKHISVILCGSEIGLLEKFVKGVDKSKASPGNAFSGLPTPLVELQHLTPDQSKQYLKSGFKEINSKILKQPNFDEIINKVVDSFGGVIGWLNNFGVQFKSKNAISDSYIEQVQKAAIPVVTQEFSSLFDICKEPIHYKEFMYSLSLQPTLEWSKLVTFVKSKFPTAETETIRDDLLDYGFIKKIDGQDVYHIPDPLHRYYFVNKLY